MLFGSRIRHFAEAGLKEIAVLTITITGETVSPFLHLHPVSQRAAIQASSPRAHSLMIALLCLACLLCLHRPVFASTDALSLLTTCRSVHHLTVEEANRHHPVRLRAAVSYYEAATDATGPSLFVVDSSGSVFVALAGSPASPLIPGDLVEVTGISSGADFAPVVAHAAARWVGRSALPRTAPRVDIGNMLSGTKDGQWVEMEAVVHSVQFDGVAATLSLFMQGGVILGRTPIERGVDYNHLVDAKILLRGNAAPLFNHQQQVTGGMINFPGIESLRVEAAANLDPFSLPASPIRELLRYTPDPDIPHRVHLRGRITLFWPGRMLCLHDAGGSVCAQVNQTGTASPGALVDLIGFPSAGLIGPSLVDATFRISGQADPVQPVQPLHLDGRQALRDQFNGNLVSTEGRVMGEDSGAADPTIILSSGKTLFSIVFARDPFLKPQHLEYGSLVHVTGICSIESDGSADPSRAGFPIAKQFRLLLRSPSDLVILEKPSWWNAVHTLRVLALALVLTLLALGRVALLSRRVRHQTAVIQTQLRETAALKDAAEFHAAHDELTGTRNRRAIFAELQHEFEAASRLGNTLGIIMVDLDHFKLVNDTYGHLTGDAVLRETVRRITLSIRSSDLVGRYGGEEFIILLPHCDKLQLQACAERIRTSIAGEPMQIGTTAIFMTTSVGTTVILPPRAMLDALAAADSALYQAKNKGRNRVVLKDLATGQFEESFGQAA